MELLAPTPTLTDALLGRLLGQLAAARGKLAPRARLTMVEHETGGGEMPPLHAHEEPEAFHVVEGTALLFAGGACVRLEAGQGAVVPARAPHAHRAESERLRFVVASFVRSPEAYARFAEALAVPERGAELREDDRVVEMLAAETGTEVLGPPGALPNVDLAA